MAPRIRLSLSKSLPTIRETQEEVMEDPATNLKRAGSSAASPDSYSSDDYIQSICHLTRPTFPGLPESSRKVEDRKTLRSLEERSWSPSFGRTLQETSNCKLTNFISSVVPLGEVTPADADPWRRENPLVQIYTQAGKLCSSKASLYSTSYGTGYSQCNSSSLDSELHPPTTKEKAPGKPNLLHVFSLPRLPSPRPVQKGAACSELKCLRRDEGAVLGSNHSQKENGPVFRSGEELSLCSARGTLLGTPALHCSGRRRSCCLLTAGTDGKDGSKNSHCDKNVMGGVPTKQRYSECLQAAKKAVSHSWISEHRCIWKEAKVKACLLPAIAEV